MALARGDRIGPYEVVDALGSGGMGEVYRARDTRLGRDVALKVLGSAVLDAHQTARFQQEARLAAALTHPNVVAVHDVGEHDGKPYLVAELLEGHTLRQELSSGAMPEDAATSVALQMAHGLAAAHAKGIVHRDIKPENVFITNDGGVKILDFGIAKLVGSGNGETLTDLRGSPHTRTGATVGTPAYMSPEQLRGDPVGAPSDIFSFGCVLYEMLAARRPFDAKTPVEVAYGVLNSDPAPLPPHVTRELADVVQRCLAKRPRDRLENGSALLAVLQAARGSITARSLRALSRDEVRRRRPSPRALLAGAAAVALVAVAVTWGLSRHWRVRHAREVDIPRVVELVEQGKFGPAAALAERVEQILPGDPTMSKLWAQMTRPFSVETTPPGAEVYVRDLAASEWNHLGRSPISNRRLPLSFYAWRVAKDGFATVEAVPTMLQGAPAPNAAVVAAPKISFTLDPVAALPRGMVRVRGSKVEFRGAPFEERGPPLVVPDFFLGRTEVTNAEFKEFVDAGGYRRRELWKHPFVDGGRTLTWEEAMARFKDRTGQHGPAVWSSGDHPEGQGNLPVTGVSWYEAAAYAAFAGRSLPTVHHWELASGSDPLTLIVGRSNFSQSALAPVGTHGLGPFGTYDMAGNAKEWCWNASGDKRYILGGAFDEPQYMFGQPDARPPFDRSAHNGFRVASYPDESALPRAAFEPLPLPVFRRYDLEKPVSDTEYHVFKRLYAYDKGHLGVAVDAVDDSPPRWRKEKISFAAPYGNERMFLFLFTPKTATSPFEPVVFFPPSVLRTRSSAELTAMFLLAPIIKSGRAVLYPVYKGTYEREDGMYSDSANESVAYRDHMVMWVKEVRRTIDFIETRADLDRHKVGFLGLSWGAKISPIILAVEERLKAAVLLSGGLSTTKALPEVDVINFITRMRQPTLMVNGRWDFNFPYDRSQRPMFELLGSLPGAKKHVALEMGHRPTSDLEMKETLEWFDRYLGPVR